MFTDDERELRPAFERTASDMYGGDATRFLDWTDEHGGEYIRSDVNAAFRAFVEGFNLGRGQKVGA